MNYRLLIIMVTAAVLMLITGGIYVRQENKKTLRAVFFKGGTTFIAASFAIYQAVISGELVPWVVCIAAILCVIADVVLQWNFIAGGAIFGGAHILFMISFLLRIKGLGLTVIFFILLFGIMLFIQRKNLINFKGKMILAVSYAVLLSGMASLGMTIFLQYRNLTGFLIALGGGCFYISDNILAKTLFSESQKKNHDACLLLFYYSSVYLLCISLY